MEKKLKRERTCQDMILVEKNSWKKFGNGKMSTWVAGISIPLDEVYIYEINICKHIYWIRHRSLIGMRYASISNLPNLHSMYT